MSEVAFFVRRPRYQRSDRDTRRWPDEQPRTVSRRAPTPLAWRLGASRHPKGSSFDAPYRMANIAPHTVQVAYLRKSGLDTNPPRPLFTPRPAWTFVEHKYLPVAALDVGDLPLQEGLFLTRPGEAEQVSAPLAYEEARPARRDRVIAHEVGLSQAPHRLQAPRKVTWRLGAGRARGDTLCSGR